MKVQRKKLAGNRLFFRIYGCFAALLLPIFVISALGYVNTRDTVVEDAKTRMTLMLTASVEEMDSKIWTIHNVGLNLFYNKQIKRSLMDATETGYFDSEGYTELFSQLIKAQNVVVSDVSTMFFYYNDEKIIKPEGTIGTDWFFAETHRYEEYDAAFWRGELEKTREIRFLPPSRVYSLGLDTGVVVPLVIASPVVGAKGVLVMDVNQRVILSVLNPELYAGGTSFRVYDRDGGVVFSLGEEAANGVRIERESDTCGWSYAVTTPYASLTESANETLFRSLLSSLVVLALSLLLTVLFARHVYTPMKIMLEIIDLPDDAEGGSLSSIKTGLDSYVERREGERETAARFAKAYLDYSFESLLHGGEVQQEELFFTQMREQLRFQAGAFVCCAVELAYQDTFYESVLDTDRLRVQSGMGDMIVELFAHWRETHVIEMSDSRYFVFWGMSGEGREEALSEALDSLQKLFSGDTIYADVYVGVGTRKESLSTLASSYAEAVAALGGCDRSQSFDCCYMTAEKLQKSALSEIEKENFSRAIADGREEDARRVIHLALSRGADGAALSSALAAAASEGLRLSGIEDAAPPPPTLHEENGTAREAEIEAWVGRLSRLMQFEREKRSPRSIVADTARYIRLHFAEDLYLERIASYMGESPRSLSQMFKAEMGVSLPDYVSHVRIEYVKDALVHTKKRVSDIAAEAGLDSRTTFIRIFKKETGLTPSEYREWHDTPPRRVYK